jgi:hypothetical protein
MILFSPMPTAGEIVRASLALAGATLVLVGCTQDLAPPPEQEPGAKPCVRPVETKGVGTSPSIEIQGVGTSPSLAIQGVGTSPSILSRAECEERDER